jgi:hypothetical protein
MARQTFPLSEAFTNVFAGWQVNGRAPARTPDRQDGGSGS